MHYVMIKSKFHLIYVLMTTNNTPWIEVFWALSCGKVWKCPPLWGWPRFLSSAPIFSPCIFAAAALLLQACKKLQSDFWFWVLTRLECILPVFRSFMPEKKISKYDFAGKIYIFWEHSTLKQALLWINWYIYHHDHLFLCQVWCHMSVDDWYFHIT